MLQKITLSVRVLLVCMCAFLYAQTTYASVYAVSPMVIAHDVSRRDILTEKITIENKDNHVIVVFPTVNEITANDGGSVLNFVSAVETDRTKSITSWLEISRAQIELQPGEKKEVTLTIRINPDAQAGEYHAFVGFPEGDNRPEAEKLVFDNRAPGSVVALTIKKEQNQFLQLEKYAVERFVKSASEGTITVTLRNPGEDAVVPGGEIIFYDNMGNEKTSIPFNSDKVAVEGKKSVPFTLQIPKDFKIGKYKAFLSIEYGDTQKATLNDTGFFYVLPLKWLVTTFVVVLFIAVSLALYVHRRYDKEEDTFGASDVAMYVRTSRSESKEHDIDLSKKTSE